MANVQKPIWTIHIIVLVGKMQQHAEHHLVYICANALLIPKCVEWTKHLVHTVMNVFVWNCRKEKKLAFCVRHMQIIMSAYVK
jgi:hypothetical protein